MSQLSEMLTAAALSMTRQIEESQLRAVIAQEQKMRIAIEKESDRFFVYVKNMIGQWTSGTTPNQISGYTRWAPLSFKWMKHKYLHSQRTRGNDYTDKYYRGTSGKLSAYISQLAKAGHANKLFGAPITKLTMGDGSEGTIDKVIITKRNQVVAMGRRPDGKYGFITAKNKSPTVTIKAFPNLQNLPANEESLAYWLGLETGKPQEWRKIYSTSNNRPLRPMIYPLIQWYIQTGFPKAIANVVKQ